MKQTTAYSIERRFFALGTVNSIRVNDPVDERVVDEAMRRVFEIDYKMSAFRPESEIGRLNRLAGKGPQELSTETFLLLKRSEDMARESGGAFDVTIRPLVELWGIGKKRGFIPTAGEISWAKALTGGLCLEDKTKSASFRKQGQAVDLGGIAKGYAADETVRVLKTGGIENAVVNFGGNVIVLGTRPDGKPWRVGIQNPLAPTGRFLGALTMKDETVVTSGSNEKFFMKDGIRYHHILDPRTGTPAQSGVLSVSAVCRRSVDADALTTALFILGPEKGAGLIRKYGADVIFVMENLRVIATVGLKDRFRIL
ncbi:MAG TPA: FAD:protein FMN transferase [Clostridia bacterium]|nr:FAD:protein FMN transferase [Clostridia bacterium]